MAWYLAKTVSGTGTARRDTNIEMPETVYRSTVRMGFMSFTQREDLHIDRCLLALRNIDVLYQSLEEYAFPGSQPRMKRGHLLDLIGFGIGPINDIPMPLGRRLSDRLTEWQCRWKGDLEFEESTLLYFR